MGEEGEEELALVGVEMDEAELVADQEVEPIEGSLQLRQAVLGLRLGELGHEPRDRHEADPPTEPAGGEPEGGRDVSLTGARRADRQDHLAPIEIRAPGELGDERRIERWDRPEVGVGVDADLDLGLIVWFA